VKLLPSYVLLKFFDRQDSNNMTKWATNIVRIKKKIEWLTSRNNDKIKKEIKPIKYSPNEIRGMELNVSGGPACEVSISPMNFKLESPLEVIHEKWFVNLSKKKIPDEVRLLLQLGERFSLPSNKNDNEGMVVDFIKCIEKNLFKEVDAIGNSIRNQSIPIIKRMHNKSNKFNHNDKMLSQWLKVTKRFVKENQDIIFTRADKGNATVAMDLSDYRDKMNNIFSDSSTYTFANKDPIKKLSNNIRNMLASWKKREYIDTRLYKKLLITDGTLPRAYGLPKLHKEGFPLRVIISSLNSPLYELACYLHKIIKDSVPEATSYVGNSFRLVNELKGKKLGPGYTLASLDVVSLFTNVPLELAYDAISDRWELIERNTIIPKNEFINAVRLVLESTYFSFNMVTYKQVFGTPMGSPFSPIIADLVLRDLETRAISKLSFTLPIYFRYVDDILLAAPSDRLDYILEVFNSFHNRLQFTLETSMNDRINFLDVTVILNDRMILFDKYEKPTNTGRYINYHSQHPMSHKKSIIYGLIDRTVLLTHPTFHEKNLKNVIITLLNNGYPLRFIFDTINNRIKMLNNRKTENVKNVAHTSHNNQKNYFTIPYVRSISESFLPITKKFGFEIAFSISNTLNRFIKRGKDVIEPLLQNDVVYKIECLNCDMTYVGQTKRRLCTRVKEHRADIKRKNGLLSVVSCHKLEYNHEMNWDGIVILDKEPAFTKRIVSEMVHIKRQKRALNKQSDTELLSEAYLPIINILSPS